MAAINNITAIVTAIKLPMSSWVGRPPVVNLVSSLDMVSTRANMDMEYIKTAGIATKTGFFPSFTSQMVQMVKARDAISWLAEPKSIQIYLNVPV